MFCKYCGNEVQENQVFCNMCGKKLLEENNSNQKVYDGKLKKCPNCGELVDSFTIKCKACGYEFREISETSSIQKLRESLDEMVSKDKDDILSKILYGDNYKSKGIRNVIAKIRNFNIPNAKEDIIDMMILAISNIDNDDDELSEAWRSKMEQAYQKAKILLKNDPSFSEIENLYKSKKEEIRIVEEEAKERWRKIEFQQKLKTWAPVAFFIIIILIWLIMILLGYK